MAPGIWVALPFWGALVAGAAFGFRALRDSGVISGNIVQTLVLMALVIFSAGCLVQVFLRYKVVSDAP